MAKQVVPTIRLYATQEDDCPVRGNALASGDDAYDKKVEDEILERLDNGDVWAWAVVEVRAGYGDLSASDYLGACSYESEKDFRDNLQGWGLANQKQK